MKNQAIRTHEDIGGIRTIARVFAVLDLLARPDAELRLTDIAQRLELPLASAHHLLARLAQLEYIEQGRDSYAYRMGPAFVRLAIRGVSAVHLDATSREPAKSLARDLAADVYVALAQVDGVSYLARYQGSDGFTLNAPLGVPRPLHATAVGKLYLASLSVAERQSRIARLDLHKFTEQTIADPATLLAELAVIERAEYAFNHQETADGVSALAVPIADGHQAFCGALIITAATRHFDRHCDPWLAAAKRAAATIARRLGADNDEHELMEET
ncbi:MAG TPA: IclR family transcriptional regulator [Candidatus Aquilonibacter sp.]